MSRDFPNMHNQFDKDDDESGEQGAADNRNESQLPVRQCESI